jgi:hypothetical protein
MIPFLVKDKIKAIYGTDLILPSSINCLRSAVNAYKGSEHDLQKSFFRWLSIEMQTNPNLYLCHAIPNGGQRGDIEGAMLKAEGVTSGIPDIFIPIPKIDHNGLVSNGLYIELKVKGNKPTEDQRAVLLMLQSQGYDCKVFNHLDDVIIYTREYLYG